MWLRFSSCLSRMFWHKFCNQRSMRQRSARHPSKDQVNGRIVSFWIKGNFANIRNFGIFYEIYVMMLIAGKASATTDTWLRSSTSWVNFGRFLSLAISATDVDKSLIQRSVNSTCGSTSGFLIAFPDRLWRCSANCNSHQCSSFRTKTFSVASKSETLGDICIYQKLNGPFRADGVTYHNYL